MAKHFIKYLITIIVTLAFAIASWTFGNMISELLSNQLSTHLGITSSFYALLIIFIGAVIILVFLGNSFFHIMKKVLK